MFKYLMSIYAKIKIYFYMNTIILWFFTIFNDLNLVKPYYSEVKLQDEHFPCINFL